MLRCRRGPCARPRPRHRSGGPPVAPGVAVEVIRTLVGSVGLVAAVPITTVLAAIVVTGTGLPARRRRRKGTPAAGAAGASWDDFAPDHA